MASINYDPKTTALLVIDMQETLRDEVIDIISNVQTIVKICHEKAIPVLWTQHGHRNLKFDGGAVGRWWGDSSIKWGSEEWKILRELQPFISRSSSSIDVLDFVIKDKTRYDSFYRTNLGSILISLGGFDQDYNIVFLKDATATENEKMREATLLNLAYGVAKIATVAEVVDWLDKR